MHNQHFSVREMTIVYLLWGKKHLSAVLEHTYIDAWAHKQSAKCVLEQFKSAMCNFCETSSNDYLTESSEADVEMSRPIHTHTHTHTHTHILLILQDTIKLHMVYFRIRILSWFDWWLKAHRQNYLKHLAKIYCVAHLRK